MPLSHDHWMMAYLPFGALIFLGKNSSDLSSRTQQSTFPHWPGLRWQTQEISPAGTAPPEYGGFGHSFSFMVFLLNFPSSFLLLLKISSPVRRQFGLFLVAPGGVRNRTLTPISTGLLLLYTPACYWMHCRQHQGSLFIEYNTPNRKKSSPHPILLSPWTQALYKPQGPIVVLASGPLNPNFSFLWQGFLLPPVM